MTDEAQFRRIVREEIAAWDARVAKEMEPVAERIERALGAREAMRRHRRGKPLGFSWRRRP